MTDIVDSATRSRMMSGIGGKNTKPEIQVRSLLHRRGFRFRLHSKDLPGKPDIVFPRFKSVIFINGCFWHGHDCSLFRLPRTRTDFWAEKIQRNRSRDKRQIEELQLRGWRVLVLWECAIRKGTAVPIADLIEDVANWLECGSDLLEVDGRGFHGRR